MTTLVVEELRNIVLEQAFNFNGLSNSRLFAVRPYLYMHNHPAGTFTISITREDDSVLTSKSFIESEVYSSLQSVQPYIHCNYPIIFDNKVTIIPGNYKIKLSASGYAFNYSSYMGWIREHEDLKLDLNYSPAYDTDNPLTFEIWVAK